jgi:2-(1,2-epoxy-1,2-dihydrophenyl)acetyl-CoA isomerase
MFHARLQSITGQFASLGQVFHASVKRLRTMPKPVLACVQGVAAGGGLSVMLACDIAIAARSSSYSLAYANIGTSPDGGSTVVLPRIVGMRKAFELAFLPDRIDSATALSLGLVNWVVEDAELEARSLEILDRLARGPTFAFARTKDVLNSTWENSMNTQLDAELAAFARCTATGDFAEGTTAFVEKRKPEFKGD